MAATDGPSSLLERAVGSPPGRALVNQAFHAYSRWQGRDLGPDRRDLAVRAQRDQLRKLVRAARSTRFGRDHDFASIRTEADFRARVPLRTYEDLWRDYLADAYPILDSVTWPGRIPFFALTSGTTQGATKYIPVSREMVRSNRRAAQAMVAAHIAARPGSNLFGGKIFFLGGSTALEEPSPGVLQGDLSGIAAAEAESWLRPFQFPPLDLALETDWDRKLTLLAERSVREPITLVGGVPSWLLALFGRVLDLTGRSTVAEVWPRLELVVHGGVKFDPYRRAFAEVLGDPAVRLQETYPCSEGFIAFGDPATGLLRPVLDHGIYYEFVPVDELGSDRPTRHGIAEAAVGVNYAIVVSTCAGMWGHIVGDTVRFESLDPPLLTFTGRTKYTLSAFGEHLISEEVEGAIAAAAEGSGASVREWHVGPVFAGALGHHHLVVEFDRPPADLPGFRRLLDADLCRRNADYAAHRVEGVGLPLPEVTVARRGGFEAWMRSRGKLGGQHKVPRMDDTGVLTAEVAATLAASGLVADRLAPGG